jgi:hypothetical protein
MKIVSFGKKSISGRFDVRVRFTIPLLCLITFIASRVFKQVYQQEGL